MQKTRPVVKWRQSHEATMTVVLGCWNDLRPHAATVSLIIPMIKSLPTMQALSPRLPRNHMPTAQGQHRRRKPTARLPPRDRRSLRGHRTRQVRSPLPDRRKASIRPRTTPCRTIGPSQAQRHPHMLDLCGRECNPMRHLSIMHRRLILVHRCITIVRRDKKNPSMYRDCFFMYNPYERVTLLVCVRGQKGMEIELHASNTSTTLYTQVPLIILCQVSSTLTDKSRPFSSLIWVESVDKRSLSILR